jgi:hypothetical protein
MEIFLATLVVFGLALLAMSIGLLSGRVRLRGSCGGIAGQCDSSGEPTLDGSGGGGLSCTLCKWTGRRTGAGGER